MTSQPSRTWATLSLAVNTDHAKTFATIVGELNGWCHEGCTVDGHSVGVCSHMVEHDGSVMGAMRALKVVAAHVIKAIDNGEEGC